jgi:hypothetical protein
MAMVPAAPPPKKAMKPMGFFIEAKFVSPDSSPTGYMVLF